MRTARRRWRAVAQALVLVALGLALVGCEAPMSTTEQHGSWNEEIWKPYWVIVILAGIVFVSIMAATLILPLMYRERPGRPARQIHGNTAFEVVWTIVPVAIVLVMMVPSLDTIFKLDEKPAADALQVEVIGHQWWFEFRYPELKITTANELHIPEGRDVNYKLRSVDVIHSFWVPQLAGKVDMVPGRDNSMHFTALKAQAEPYLGQCVEFCGTSHANMRFRVFVHTPEDFAAWAKREAADRTSAVARAGEEAFLAAPCIGCHTVRGTDAAGIAGPDLTHIGSRSTIGSGILDNTPANLKRWISNSGSVKPGSKMPPMAESAGGTLSDEQLNAIVAYLQSLK
jgi:cytochrome c oxidase subunit 2